jgi:hypothetical protein
LITFSVQLLDIKNGRAFFEHEGRCFTLPLTKEQDSALAGAKGRTFALMLDEAQADPVTTLYGPSEAIGT